VPNLHESASVDAEGNLNITVCNLSCTECADIDAILVGFEASSVEAEIVTAEFGAYNDFDAPDTVKTETFEDVRLTQSGAAFTIPPCSVVRVTLKP